MKPSLHFVLLLSLSSFPAFGQKVFTNGNIIKAHDGNGYYIVYGNAIIPINKADISSSAKIIKAKKKRFNGMSDKPNKPVLLKERNARTVFLVNGAFKQEIDTSVLDLYFMYPLVVNVDDHALDKFELKSERIALPEIIQGSLKDTLKKVIAYRFKKDISKSINSVDPKSLEHEQLESLIKAMDNVYQNSPGYGYNYHVPSGPPPVNPAKIPSNNPWPPIIPNPGLRGFADIHSHQFANYGFGGELYAGEPFGDTESACSITNPALKQLLNAEYSIVFASCMAGSSAACVGFPNPVTGLPDPLSQTLCAVIAGFVCSNAANDAVSKTASLIMEDKIHGVDGKKDVLGNIFKLFFLCQSKFQNCLSTMPPGDANTIIDAVLMGKPLENLLIPGNVPFFNQLFMHGPQGSPDFTDWPSWKSFNHQFVPEWGLYQAWRNGLRLMVVYAVDNNHLCEQAKTFNQAGKFPCNEMDGIYRQIEKAKEMEIYIKNKYNSDWYKIVYSGQEAYQAIKDGKLAVILGIETSNIMDCENDNNCGYSAIQNRVDNIYDMGIRTIFIAHENDDAFAGASVFNATKSEPMLGQFSGNFPLLKELWVQDIKQINKTNTTFGKGVNAKGLTDKGRFLVQYMMHKGMILEIDHLSEKAKNQVLDLAQAAHYPGVVASHVGFTGINQGEQLHEGQISNIQLSRIYNLGGMVGLIANQGNKQEVNSYYAKIPHTCGLSSVTFAQAYKYAVDQIGDLNKGIAIGTDFNAPIAQIGPRFGSDACWGGGNNSYGTLNYPYYSQFFQNGTKIAQTKLGTRTYDFNYDGLSHVGMLPDLFADLNAIGIPYDTLEPIFNSAKYYAQMWINAENTKLMHLLQDANAPELYVYEVSNQGINYKLRNGKRCQISCSTNSSIIFPDVLNQYNLPVDNCQPVVSYTIKSKDISAKKYQIIVTTKDPVTNQLVAGTVKRGNFVSPTNTPFWTTYSCTIKTIATNSNPKYVNVTVCDANLFTVEFPGCSNYQLSVPWEY